jgi:hypothetical protein
VIRLILSSALACQRQEIEGREIEARSLSASATVACGQIEPVVPHPAVHVLIYAGMDQGGKFTAPGRLDVTLESYATLRKAIGRTFHVAPGVAIRGRSSKAMWCKAPGTCTSATGGWIRLERQDAADSTLLGRFWLAFPDSTALQGRFEAEWWRMWQLC